MQVATRDAIHNKKPKERGRTGFSRTFLGGKFSFLLSNYQKPEPQHAVFTMLSTSV